MSSNIFVINSEEIIPNNISSLDLILWTISNVSKNLLGSSSFINKVPVCYISRATSYNVSCNWGDYIQYIYDIQEQEAIEIDKQKIKDLFNSNTIAIYHERIGYLNKVQWGEYVDQTTFILAA